MSNNCNVIYLAEPAVKTTKPVDISKQCHDSNSGDVIAPDKATPCNICNAHAKMHIPIYLITVTQADYTKQTYGATNCIQHGNLGQVAVAS